MTVIEFEKRAKFHGGYDREFGKWKIIDIHQIEYPLLEQHELDFYCCDNKTVYLLRLRNRQDEKYIKLPSGDITYLIAELPIHDITNDFINKTLSRFDLSLN